MTKKSENNKMTREEYLYHNTEMLLKKYRDVVWSVEVSALQTQMSFEDEFDCAIEDFIELAYDAGADLSGTQIQEQVRTMERNKKMLKMIDAAVGILRKKKNVGEAYYWILHFTYFSEETYCCIEDIIDKINEKIESISWKTYFRKRKEAIDLLSAILWGFTAKDSLKVLKDFEGK